MVENIYERIQRVDNPQMEMLGQFENKKKTLKFMIAFGIVEKAQLS